MYTPAAFAEQRLDVMVALMQRYPLATLVVAGADGLSATHVPLLYDPEPAPWGMLRGHVARANPIWSEAGGGALAIFHGPQAYVSPSFYPSMKEHGRVVPTWNYAVVHAHSREVVTHEDRAWLLRVVEQLTDAQEAAFAEPWRVSDAPRDYVEGLLGAIVGIEMRIDRLAGKWKASQNQKAVDAEGARAGLASSEDPAARAMALLIGPESENGQ